MQRQSGETGALRRTRARQVPCDGALGRLNLRTPVPSVPRSMSAGLHDVPARCAAALAQLLPALRDRIASLTDANSCVAEIRRLSAPLSAAEAAAPDIAAERRRRVAALWEEVKLRGVTRAVAGAGAAAALAAVLAVLFTFAARVEGGGRNATRRRRDAREKEAVAVSALVDELLGVGLDATAAAVRASAAAVATARRWAVVDAETGAAGSAGVDDMRLLLRQAWAAVETASPDGVAGIVRLMLPSRRPPAAAAAAAAPDAPGTPPRGADATDAADAWTAQLLVDMTLDAVRSPAFAPALAGAVDAAFGVLDDAVLRCVFGGGDGGGDAGGEGGAGIPRPPPTPLSLAVAVVRLRGAVDDLLAPVRASGDAGGASDAPAAGDAAPSDAPPRLLSRLVREAHVAQLCATLMWEAKMG